jgi:glutathione synthase/RimK-type ligase-like ATP-grasp enzyme
MIYIIHDNPKWLQSIHNELKKQGMEYQEWNLNTTPKHINKIKLDEPPPEGIFYNRVSASSHTRGARYSLEYCRHIVLWLEKWGRRVINGSHTIGIEASKLQQYLLLHKGGIGVPQTRFASGREDLIQLGKEFFDRGKKCIIKDNRGGSGISVQLVESIKEIEIYLDSPDYQQPIDGTHLIQEYIESKDHYITRLEFIHGQFIYAVRVNTSNGFKLCPADTCNLDRNVKKFEIIKDFPHPQLIQKCLQVIQKNKIDVCGMECIEDRDGNVYIYDINCNTNYNSDAEEEYGQRGLAVELLFTF